MIKLIRNNTVFVCCCVVVFILWLFCFKLISPGYVGVVVDLLGDKKGVESKELLYLLARY